VLRASTLGGMQVQEPLMAENLPWQLLQPAGVQVVQNWNLSEQLVQFPDRVSTKR